MASARRIDPTRTLTLQKTYYGKLGKRFTSLKGDVNTTLKDNNAVQLRAATYFPVNNDADRIAEFNRWIDGQLTTYVLEEVGDNYVRAGMHHTGRFVDEAALRGIKRANQELSVASIATVEPKAALAMPVHKELLEMAYMRHYEGLRDITQDTAKQMRRVFAEGIRDGDGAYAIARNLNDRIDKIGRTRAEVLARTEIVRDYNIHSLQTYERAGIKEVTAEVEMLTAGDNRVCAECQDLNGVLVPIKDAYNFLPRHPRCRCAWVIPRNRL